MPNKNDTIPCWKITNCPAESREKCAVYVEQLGPCWLSPVEKRCPIASRITSCKECPVYQMYHEPETATDPVPKESAGAILIVDDEMLIRWSLCQAFRRIGYDVSVAASSEDAREQVRREMFNIILMDMKLPGLDGLAAAEEFLKLSPSSQVILMTACGTDDMIANASKLGIKCIKKPLDIEHIPEILG